MPTVGTYPRNTMLVMLLGLGCFWIVFIGILVALFCCAGQAQGAGRAVAIVATILIVVDQCITVTGFALLAGFGFMPPYAGFLISSTLWVPVIMLSMSLCSPAWKTTILVARQCRRSNDSDEGAKPTGSCITIRSLCKASFQASLRRPLIFMVCTTAALLATLAMHLALSEVCSLSNPDTITTWASRRADPRYCDAGEFCHAYVMAGQRSSRVRLVGHIVTDELVSPFRAEAVICEVAALNVSLCITPTWVVAGSLLDLRAPEDPRFVMHILLTNLTGERYYSAELRFVHGVAGGGVGYSTKIVSWMALPDETSNTPIRFLAGGDVYQGRPFTQLLMVAMVAEPDPHFILLGGDLAYANSMRTCYLRWDQFLRDLSAIRTGKGFSLPIITIVGNHEAGGYMVQKARSSYNFYVQYLPQYDDDVPTDSTITYHSHYIGKLLGLICLDSSIMIPAPEQVPFLTNTLLLMSNPTVPALSKFVIVLQHNPMFPSSRDWTDDTSTQIRSVWMPVYDTYKVPLVLEFHDHAYKRTWPMFQGTVRTTDGTVYLGDGALGVYDPSRTPDPSRNYLQKTLPLNYILLMKLYPNGTLFSEAWSTDNAKIDSFSLDRR